jgi:hypothetical protein
MDRQKMIAEIDAEIANLTRARDALVGNGAGSERSRNVSSEGRSVIATSARLRWARERLQKNPKDEALQADVKLLEKKLESARKAMEGRGRK